MVIDKRNFAMKYEGLVQVGPTVGEGCTFYVNLPNSILESGIANDLQLGFGICKLTIRRKVAPVVHLL